MNPQLENLGVLDLGFDFDIEGDPFGFNISEEGLDFIPLPPGELTANFQDAEMPIGNFTGAYANILVEEEKSVDLDSETPITINNENSRLVQHYLNGMKGYAKLDEFPHKASNLFVSAFSKSLQFPPLFYAILAFSASHLSVEDESYSRQASRYTSLADSSFQNHNQGEDTDIDALLSALVVRIRTVHMMGGEVETFHSIIKVAADIVSSKRGAQL
jgi:hypothetical protein